MKLGENPYRPPKSRVGVIVSKLWRTPAQKAFDHCIIVLGSCIIANLAIGLLTTFAWKSKLAWIGYPIAAGLAWQWLKATLGVLRVWRARDAKVLRFSAVGVLVLASLTFPPLLLLCFYMTSGWEF